MTRRQEQRVAEVLFRESVGTRCDFAELSKRTGIPQRTLYRYRQNPDTIPCGRFFEIVTAMRLDSKQCGYLLTGKT